MRLVLALTAALVALPTFVEAAGPSKYVMKGPCRVHTTSGPSFDETFHPEVRAVISGPDHDLKVELTSEGHTCVVKGTKKGDLITLPAGQKCPQKLDRDGIRGDLEGVLASGKATVKGKAMTLVTSWNVTGQVKLAFKNIDVKGVVDTNVKGSRVP